MVIFCKEVNKCQTRHLRIPENAKTQNVSFLVAIFIRTRLGIYTWLLKGQESREEVAFDTSISRKGCSTTCNDKR